MCPGYSYLRGTNEENKLCYGISTLQIREYLPKLNYFSSIVKWKIFPLVTCYFERHHWEEFFFFYFMIYFYFILAWIYLPFTKTIHTTPKQKLTYSSGPEFFFYIYFLKFIFNCRIIALQCSVGFCHASTWISHMYTHVCLASFAQYYVAWNYGGFFFFHFFVWIHLNFSILL